MQPTPHCQSGKLIPSPLDEPDRHGTPQLEHDVLASWIIRMASPILHAAMWGEQDIDAEH